MTIAVEYTRAEGVKDILGIHVAVDDLLKSWFRYGKQEQFICRPQDMPSYEHFRQLTQAAGLNADEQCVGLDPRTPQHNLAGITCLFRPDPALAAMAWRRRQLPGKGYAACGLLHSLSGEQVSRTVSELCLAPLDETDALICPSTAIRDAVRNLWDMHAEYLNHRFGGAYHCAIQAPVIPLGIDTAKFSEYVSPDKRRAQREALGIQDGEVVLLFVGRLSFATKAHPLPLMLAVEQAAKRTKRKLRLVMYGYFKPQADMEPRFRALASDICKTARCEFITNDDPRFPEGLWAGADIFTSLVDNIQESFGLTPIEAMACGLPVVATDWDGYRDGVRHGTDGFLIPTALPPAIAGQAIAEFYANENNYGAYLCGAAQSTAVDIAAAADAFVALAEDDAMRRAMGESGRLRGRQNYDWKVLIPDYEALWRELAGKRLMDVGANSLDSAKRNSPLPGPPRDLPALKLRRTEGERILFHPAYPNPFAVFEGFASRILRPADRLRIFMGDEDINVIMKHDMNLFIPELLMPPELLREMIAVMRKAGSTAIVDMLALFPAPEQPRLWRCLGWMLKHGIAAREAA